MSSRNTCSRLRHRMVLQQEVQTSDMAGGYIRSWQDIASLWAEIIPLGGSDSRLNTTASKEIFAAGQLQSQVSHKILLRYREAVTPAMRLLLEQRVFNIRSVITPFEKKEHLELLVQEGVAD